MREPVMPCAGTAPVVPSSALSDVESAGATAFIGIAGVCCSSTCGSLVFSSSEEPGASDSHGRTPDEAGASFLGERDATGMDPVAAGRADGIWPVAGNNPSSDAWAGASAFVRAEASE